MVHIRRHVALLPLFSLLVAPACGGDSGSSDESSSGSTTVATSSTGGDDTTTTSTTSTDPTTNPTGLSDPTGDTTTDEPTTDPGTTTTTTDPGTSTTTTTTDPGTDTTADTGDDTTGADDSTSTGGVSDLPEIPDDGMPTGAHHKKVPLGTAEAQVGYWEYTPAGYGGGDKYPLMVFLHGIGENGNGDSELDKVVNNGPPKLIQNDQWKQELPFVVLSPQHPGGGCPGPAEIHDFITFATTHYDINLSRVYLTGLSCGAIGAWGYLGEYLDEQIAALVPVAGDGKGAIGKAHCDLGKVPIWAFHGDADDTVNVSGTVVPVTELKACDPVPDVDMVIYPGVGHDSWTMTYDLSSGHDIYAWLLEHSKP